jgi:hypothetical protein
LFVLLPTLAHAQHATPVVTKAFMREVATGKLPAAKLVDPDTGLVVIDYVTDERDPVEKSSRRLCGSAAEAHLRSWVKTHLRPAVDLDELSTTAPKRSGSVISWRNGGPRIPSR